MTYIGESDEQVRMFLTLLFGSWKIISDQKKVLLTSVLYEKSNVIDLVVFCEPKSCQLISGFCTVVSGIKDIVVEPDTPRCWAVHQTIKIDIPYTPLNSYVMCIRPDINLMTERYQYLLRSDYDVFLTPGLFLFKTTQKLLFSKGGYSGEFPNKRLKGIAQKIGLRHQGFHSVGSTWYGETDFFIKAGRVAYNATRYMFLNEFKHDNPEISKYFKVNKNDGEWPYWWRPVSSMYGGELAVNHVIDGISQNNRGRFDTSSCETRSIWSTVHVHCWHSDCEFQKFRFTKYLGMIINSQNGIPGPILHLLVENMYSKDVTNMTIRDFATHTAWYSVGRYLKKWIVKNELIPHTFEHDKKPKVPGS